MVTTDEKRRRFRDLHEAGCFVLPNPWDVGTARLLQSMGFAALASTSSGVAFAHGLPDTDWAVPVDVMLAHLVDLCAAVDLPVNADFESGYARDLDGLAANVAACIATGVAGLSIEDSNGGQGASGSLFSFDESVARVRRSCEVVAGTGVLLTARCEGFLVGLRDLDEVVRRLVAYAAAGADVLYAPVLPDAAAVARVVAAVAPKPVNVLVSGAGGFDVAGLAALGVRRVSTGSGLARVALGAFQRAAQGLAATGRFDDFAGAVPFGEINGFFRRDLAARAGA